MNKLIDELISHFFDNKPQHREAVPFGLTNFTQVIEINGQKYVARIYDRYTKNIERLKFEMELMSCLERLNLSFQLPLFLVTASGERIRQLSSGQYGSMTRFIEGEAPDLTITCNVKEYGSTVGEISKAMQLYSGTVPSRNIKFTDVFQLHPLCTKKTLLQYLEESSFAIDDTHWAMFMGIIQRIEHEQEVLEQLPRQIIHHDLLLFNLLMNNTTGKMCGVLDFDFASFDVRALELAVCINHILQINHGSLAYVEVFLEQYGQHMRLTDEELSWIPFLMQLYYGALLCIYIGQHYSGRDTSTYFQIILQQLVDRGIWLEDHHEQLLQLLQATIRDVN